MKSEYDFHHQQPLLNLSTSVGVEPDESPGDPAAGVLAPHQPAGEAHPPADSGDFTSWWKKQVNSQQIIDQALAECNRL